MQVISRSGRVKASAPSGFSGMQGISGFSGSSGVSGFSSASQPGLIGTGCVQTGTDSNAGGTQAAALGNDSIAVGFKPLAIGIGSVALGTGAGISSTIDIDKGIATGNNSLSGGYMGTAFGHNSFCFGKTNAAYANNSVSTGGYYNGAGDSGNNFTVSGTTVTIPGTDATAEYQNGDQALCYALTGGTNNTLKSQYVTISSVVYGGVNTTMHISSALDDRTGGIIADVDLFQNCGTFGGYENFAFAQNAVTLGGNSNSANGLNTIAGGYGSYAGIHGINSTAFGVFTGTQGPGSFACGHGCSTGVSSGASYTGGEYAFACGFQNVAGGTYSIATGNFAKALGKLSFCGGNQSIAWGTNSFTFGSYTQAQGTNSVALVNGIASNTNAVCIGGNNSAGLASVSLGQANAFSDGALAGGTASVAGQFGFAAGDFNQVGQVARGWTRSGNVITIAGGDFRSEFSANFTTRMFNMSGGTLNTLFNTQILLGVPTYNSGPNTTTFNISAGAVSDRTSGACVQAAGWADYGSALGIQAYAYRQGQHSHANGQFNRVGDAQSSEVVMSATTLDATATEMTFGGGSPDTINKINKFVMNANTSCCYDIQVMARNSAPSSTNACFYLKGFIIRDATLASTRIVTTGTTKVNDAGAAGWSVTATADTTYGDLKLSVIGQVGNSIHWVATVRMTESGW